jgi:tetratricopeptide (TPR) repeat protein
MYTGTMRACLSALVLLVVVAGSAEAQFGQVNGIIRDDRGNPVKGATIVAENPDASPQSFTASSDENGRFAMVGLRTGLWSLRAGAPGHFASGTDVTVRALPAVMRPLNFVLQKLTVPPSALGQTPPADLQAALSSADALYNSEKWDEAIKAYRAILEKSPALSTINLQIAAVYRNKKEYDNAIGAYNALLQLDPANEKAKVGIARTNVEKGDLETAERTLEIAAQAPGATPEVFYDLGEVKLSRARADEAIKAYERAVQADPAWGKPQLALGRIAMDKGDAVTARKYFQTVMDVDPVSAEATEATAMLRQLEQIR